MKIPVEAILPTCAKCNGEGWIFYHQLDEVNQLYKTAANYPVDCDWCW